MYSSTSGNSIWVWGRPTKNQPVAAFVINCCLGVRISPPAPTPFGDLDRCSLRKPCFISVLKSYGLRTAANSHPSLGRVHQALAPESRQTWTCSLTAPESDGNFASRDRTNSRQINVIPIPKESRQRLGRDRWFSHLWSALWKR